MLNKQWFPEEEEKKTKKQTFLKAYRCAEQEYE